MRMGERFPWAVTIGFRFRGPVAGGADHAGEREQGNSRSGAVGLVHAPAEFIVGFRARGVLDNRFRQRLERPLRLPKCM